MGAGRSAVGLLWLVMQTPWIAYVFLVLLAYFLLSAFLEQKKFFGYVQVTIVICIPVVAFLKDAQGFEWEYWTIWVAGVIGCLVYWIERMIDSSPLNDLD